MRQNQNAKLNRRHLRLLLLLTLLVKGLMFVSYPLGAGLRNDNEAAQKFLIDEYASGNFMVGNLRYNTGYALVMAPFKTLGDNFGDLSDRVLLLLQTLATGLIPLLAYDMLRRRLADRAALAAACVVLLDPFALQWAHYQLPGWLVGLMLVAALWLGQLAWQAERRWRLALIALAAVILGFMSFARFNMAPLAAVYGASLLLWRHIGWRERLTLFGAVGIISGGILGGYLLLIHIPTTGTTTLSCAAGATQLASLPLKGYELRASNGPHSRRYAELLTLPALREIHFHPETYPLWREPGPWVSQAEQAAFLAQPVGAPQEDIRIVFPAALYWYLGPCAADALLYDVYFETVAREPLRLLTENLRVMLASLLQAQAGAIFPLQYLDAPESLTWLDAGMFGFRRAESATYNGHLLWQPGVHIYSALFPLLHLVKLLMPFALLHALWRRDWLLLTAAAMLLLGVALIALVAAVEPRYYASLAPLYGIVIGALVGAALERLPGVSRAIQSQMANS